MKNLHNLHHRQPFLGTCKNTDFYAVGPGNEKYKFNWGLLWKGACFLVDGTVVVSCGAIVMVPPEPMGIHGLGHLQG